MAQPTLDHLRLTTLDDTMALLAGLWRTPIEIPVLVVVLDRHRAVLDLHPITGAVEADVPQVLATVLHRHAGGPATEVLVVTDRSARAPVVTADDELTWQEWVGLVESFGLLLLDWLVRVDGYAFSVAEFAPTPARW